MLLLHRVYFSAGQHRAYFGNGLQTVSEDTYRRDAELGSQLLTELASLLQELPMWVAQP